MRPARSTCSRRRARSCPESPFVFLSTNKVYGDSPNELELVELETRYDYADPDAARRDRRDLPDRRDDPQPVRRVQGCGGSPGPGVRALLRHADRLLPRRLPHRARITRAPSSTGSSPTSRGACSKGRTYRIYGYKGKQVRDNLHASDVCAAALAFAENASAGRRSTTSAAAATTPSRSSRRSSGSRSSPARQLAVEYVDEPRRGDHICYISDLGRLRGDYPSWNVTVTLDEILGELVRPTRETRSRHRRRRLHRIAPCGSSPGRRLRGHGARQPLDRRRGSVSLRRRRSSRETSPTASSSMTCSRTSTSTRCSTSPARRASGSRSRGPRRDLATNVLGTVNVLRGCIESGVPRLVHASSMTVYGEPDRIPTPEDVPCVPVSYYGVTKYAAERYVHITGDRPDVDLAVTSLRMFNVFGPRQSISEPVPGRPRDLHRQRPPWRADHYPRRRASRRGTSSSSTTSSTRGCAFSTHRTRSEPFSMSGAAGDIR